MNWHNILIAICTLSSAYIVLVGLWQLLDEGGVRKDVKIAFVVLAVSVVLIAGLSS